MTSSSYDGIIKAGFLVSHHLSKGKRNSVLINGGQVNYTEGASSNYHILRDKDLQQS